jgi:hypothetical protein
MNKRMMNEINNDVNKYLNEFQVNKNKELNEIKKTVQNMKE